MDPDNDGLAAELELLQAMYTVEEDELCITGGAPGSTEVAIRLRPQTGGERAQRFMEVVLQLRCGDGYPSKSAPTIRLQRARGLVEDEEAQLLRGVHARAAELQGELPPYLRLCPCPCPAPPPLPEPNLPLRPTPFAPTLSFAPAPSRIPTLTPSAEPCPGEPCLFSLVEAALELLTELNCGGECPICREPLFDGGADGRSVFLSHCFHSCHASCLGHWWSSYEPPVAKPAAAGGPSGKLAQEAETTAQATKATRAECAQLEARLDAAQCAQASLERLARASEP